MADDCEIDLYDNMDDTWKRENLEIYDDVDLQSNEESQEKVTNQTNQSGKRVATYVGNLRWWTTDQDLMDAVTKIGINDVLEIKFHENRQNGQSKGFCVMVFGSDKSAKDAMEKLPKSEIHGLAPIVTFCNKQNLNYFEQAAGGPTSSGNNNNSNNTSNNNFGTKIKTENVLNNNRNNGATTTYGGSQIGGFNNNNNNQINQMKMPNMSIGNNMPAINPSLLFNLQNTLQNTLNNSLLNTNNNNNNQMGNNRTAPIMMLPTPISTPMNINNNQMNMSNNQRMINPNMMMNQTASMQIPINSGHTPHLNPNFFNVSQASNLLTNMLGGAPNLTNPTSNTNTNFDTFGRALPNNFGSFSPKISEVEFDEILQRNKTVSSSAISRAVADASSGDYASAIETLVTAISLIKQSKIASDSRCKVLINSLQDTLTGIESKSYGSRKSRRRISYSESSSEGDRDESNEYRSNRRVLRSRSRDRRRRSRDYGGHNQTSGDFFGNLNSTGSTSDRYSNRYRH